MRRVFRKIGWIFIWVGLISLVWLLVSLSSKNPLSPVILIGLVLLFPGAILLRWTDAAANAEPVSPSRRVSQQKHKSWIDRGN